MKPRLVILGIVLTLLVNDSAAIDVKGLSVPAMFSMTISPDAPKWTDTAIVLLTIALVIGQGGMWWVMWRTLNQTKAANLETKRSVDAMIESNRIARATAKQHEGIERGSLALVSVEVDNDLWNTVTGLPVSFAVKNIGRSTVELGAISYSIYDAQTEIPPEPDGPYDQSLDVDVVILANDLGTVNMSIPNFVAIVDEEMNLHPFKVFCEIFFTTLGKKWVYRCDWEYNAQQSIAFKRPLPFAEWDDTPSERPVRHEANEN